MSCLLPRQERQVRS